MKIALVTCRVLPEADNDADLLLETCLRAGLDARYAAWDDDSVDWAAFDLAILRSTWNYHRFESQFRQWIENARARTRLLNPPDLMLGNIHKSYLLELQGKGLPVVPTRIVTEPGFTRAVEGWDEVVVKPAVSASSYLTERFVSHDVENGERFLLRVLEHGDAMVQPFLKRVANGGEIAVVWIDREITHAVVKQPRFADGHESVSTAVQPTAEQTGVVLRVLATLDVAPLYARIDLMEADDGAWVLSELELIEPSLFLVQNPVAAERLVRGILRMMPEWDSEPSKCPCEDH